MLGKIKGKKVHIIKDKNVFYRIILEKALKLTKNKKELWFSDIRKGMLSYPAHKNWFGSSVMTKDFKNNFKITDNLRKSLIESTNRHTERMYIRIK